MKRYLSNILIYMAALFGIVAFIGMFSSPLFIYDPSREAWIAYNVKAYLGEVSNGVTVYKGTFVPIFGYVIPFIMAIFLILESFKPSLAEKLTAINTLFAILFFGSAVLVLLTKELFLNANDLGNTNALRNGTGPIMSAAFSSVAGIILLIVTYIPKRRTNIDFIKK